MAEKGGHGFRPGADSLDEALIHGASCADCHQVLRDMSADRCCRFHYLRRYGRGWAAYQAKRRAALAARHGPPSQ